jgi:hypothetical protein
MCTRIYNVCLLIKVLKVLRVLGIVTCKEALHIRFEKLCLQFTIISSFLSL